MAAQPRLGRELILRDYRTLSPCDRIDYYRAMIRRLSPPSTRHEGFLVILCQTLIRENRPLCPGSGGRAEDEGDPR